MGLLDKITKPLKSAAKKISKPITSVSKTISKPLLNIGASVGNPLALIGGGKPSGLFGGFGFPGVGFPGLPPSGDDKDGGILDWLLDLLGLPDVKTLLLYAAIGLGIYLIVMKTLKL